MQAIIPVKKLKYRNGPVDIDHAVTDRIYTDNGIGSGGSDITTDLRNPGQLEITAIRKILRLCICARC